MVVEAGRWGSADDYVLEQVKQARGIPVLAINKIDALPKREALLPDLAQAAARHEWADLVPIMARRGENVPRLLSVLRGHLPPGPHHYEADALTDRSERFLVAEVIREKLTRRLGDELPHQLSVEIERWREGSDKREIHGAIWVERPGQRAIILGHQGSRIKEVGIEARQEIERRFGRPVRLEPGSRCAPAGPTTSGPCVNWVTTASKADGEPMDAGLCAPSAALSRSERGP